MIKTTAWITGLSLVTWTFYRQALHATPTRDETMILVGACALCVFAGKALLRLRRKWDRRAKGANR
jgi:hypothetical protein